MVESVGNVPPALSSFVGRASELAEVERLLGASRLVTLTGAGGCGKSRLALEAATRVAARFGDGAWQIDLAPLSDPRLVPTVVAGALGVREAAVQDLTETLCDRLADESRLLVFDNCEHLCESVAALVEAVLRRCPSVAVLATSRARVGIEGEVAFLVPPLSLPGADDETAGQSESVQLFVARAAEAGTRVDVSRAVSEICRELDGMPLALELAAARTRMLTPEQILDGLADRFRLLFGSKRGGAPRHRTLRASVDWSHHLLSPDEQVLFRRLAVFPADFSFESVGAICGGPPLDADHVVESLAGLVDQSLVTVERGSDRVRYRLLETVRTYARERLDASDEAVEISDRHLGVFLRLAEEAAPALHGHDQLQWLERLDHERADFRAAFAWARASGNVDVDARLVAALAYYHVFRGAITEITMQVSLLNLPPAGVDPRVRAELLLLAAGGMIFLASNADGARILSEAALAVAVEEGDLAFVGRAQFQIGLADMHADGARAAARFEDAIAASRVAGDDMYLGMALSDLGLVLHMIGDPSRVDALLEDGLGVSRRSGSRWAEANALMFRAQIRCDTGDLDGAREDLLEAIARCGDLGELLLRGFQHTLLAEVLVASGDVDGGRREVTAGLALAKETGSALGRAWGMRRLGVVELAGGNVERARAELERALELGTGLGISFVAAEAFALLGVAELRQGRLDRAEAAFDDAEHAARDRWIVPWTLTLLGRAELARRMGDISRAHAIAHDALEVAMPSRLSPLAVEALNLLALTTPAGHASEAVFLQSCARACRARTGTLWSMVLGTTEVALDERGRAGLSDISLSSAEERGRQAMLEEAVAFAQRGRGHRGRPAFGWDSLSPVQLEVVGLVAAGLTNRQIGEKLFISPRTVQSHLRDVFPRVGVSTRGELAAEAARRGI